MASWHRLDLAGKRQVIQVLMKITLLPPGRGARTFDPATSRSGGRARHEQPTMAHL
jgi:hypothetical protein